MSVRSLLTIVFVWLASTLYAQLSGEVRSAPIGSDSVLGVCGDAMDSENSGEGEVPAGDDPVEFPGGRLIAPLASGVSSPNALRSSACRNLGHPNSISGIAEFDRLRTAAAVHAVVHTIQPDTPALTAVATPIRTHAPPQS